MRKIIVDLEKQIHSLVGKPFLIDSPDKLAKILAEIGVDTKLRTAKTKNMVTGIDELELVKDQHPAIPLIIKYKTLMKQMSSYIEPFMKHYREDLGGFRISYQATNAPTARLSSGLKDKETRYFAKLNVQSIPKPEPQFFSVIKSDAQKSILGYDFVPDENGLCEGLQQDYNSRAFFIPYPGHYVVDMDYSGEEVVILANMSKDPAFLEPLKNKEDLHKATAFSLWGPDAYDKERRRIAKISTFGLIYGGYPETLHKSLPEKSMEECEDIFNRWWKLHSHLRRYQLFCQTEARKKGFFQTPFGRIRRVDFYYKSPDRRDSSFADRTVSNFPQGVSGDIMRYVLIKMYERVMKKPEWEGKVFFMSTLHDEFVFSVTKEKEFFTPIVLELKNCMEDLAILNFEVPLEANVSIGTSWGRVFDFKYDGTEWSPKSGE